MLEFVNESIKMGEIENMMTGKGKIQFTSSGGSIKLDLLKEINSLLESNGKLIIEVLDKGINWWFGIMCVNWEEIHLILFVYTKK